MPMKLAMLGAWHTHAEGLVRQMADHPEEFTLVGLWDSDPRLAAERCRQWQKRFPGLRTFDKPETLLGEPLDGVAVEGRVYENLKLARLALESGRQGRLLFHTGQDDSP
jgi:predicted dehydrogenase